MTYMPKQALSIEAATKSNAAPGYRSCLNIPVLAMCAAVWAALWITGASLAALF